MIGLKREGKIRHLALSNVSLAQLEQALERTPLVGVQNLYNVAHGERQLGQFPYAAIRDQEAIVDLCAARGLAFLPFFPLALPGSDLPPSAAIAELAERRGVTPSQVALAWLLARSPALLPIPGTSSLAHLEENWASHELALSATEFEAISQARA
jgi:aryl-alcohol dehydrogenase-like predicted oxidoreductase